MNENVKYCENCNEVIGMDRSWNWHEHCTLACRWLGARVSFTLGGVRFEADVVETERMHLANGIHDILTVEIFDGSSQKQVKIQMHRQAFKKLQEPTVMHSDYDYQPETMGD